MKSLVIVESPAKAKTIEKFLGKDFKVVASVGHLRDLPKSQMGVDLENDFEPKYVTIRGKGDITKMLKQEANKADKVYLATDPDREGEAISWHIEHILKIDEDEKVRVEFHEITKDIVKSAIEKPRKIDLDLVDAQQARRILDRIVGYTISPLLWNKIGKGLSAGRVQSVALKIISDREEEIKAFVPEEYWSIKAILKDGKAEYEADFYGILKDNKEEKLPIANEEEANEILENLNKKNYLVQEVKRGKKNKNPSLPFITSTLQQEASKKLGFTSRKTMQVAQNLYEGLSIGKGNQAGLITYMRTDSTRLSKEAVASAKTFIQKNYGKEYSNGGKTYGNKNKKESQDAHEAIRPTDVFRTPESLKKYLNPDQYKLYTMIWKRFVASQMSQAVYNTISATIINNGYIFKINNSKVSFLGFLKVYDYDEEEKGSLSAGNLKEGDKLTEKKLEPNQHFTKPPARYTEASLIKTLEELGIGRPSTFSSIISILLNRRYVSTKQKSFYQTELGKKVNGILQEYFSSTISEGFTAEMENKLDEIAEGELNWKDVIREFYVDFEDYLKKADKEIEKEKEEVRVSDEKCENCGRNLVYKRSRYGEFLACPAYPECKFTKSIVKKLGIKCPECGGEIVIKYTKGGKEFYGCENYPNCDFVSWDEPSNIKCPTCNGMMVYKRRKKGDYLQCINKECGEKVYNLPEEGR